jgi:hypothetical protein
MTLAADGGGRHFCPEMVDAGLAAGRSGQRISTRLAL